MAAVWPLARCEHLSGWRRREWPFTSVSGAGRRDARMCRQSAAKVASEMLINNANLRLVRMLTLAAGGGQPECEPPPWRAGAGADRRRSTRPIGGRCSQPAVVLAGRAPQSHSRQLVSSKTFRQLIVV
jgi:hypothetical protein